MSIDDTLTERGDRGDTIEGFTDKPITFSQVSILRDPAQNHAKKARLHFGTSPVQGDDKDIKKALSRENQYCLVFEESNNGANPAIDLLIEKYGPHSDFGRDSGGGYVRPYLVDRTTGKATTGGKEVPHSEINTFTLAGTRIGIGGIFFNRKLADTIIPELEKAGYRITRETEKESVVDQLYESGIPEEVVGHLSTYLSQAATNEVKSKHPTFKAVTKDGEKVLIKINGDRATARIEAAANFYLSQHFDFIAPGMFPEPLESNGLYITVQRDVSAEATNTVMPIEYWITSLAMFHKESEKILREEGLTEIREYDVRSLDHILEQQAMAKHLGHRTFPLDVKKLEEGIAYLEETSYKTVIHGDNKDANRMGPYLVDLELIGRGSPAVDLGLLFMQYNVPKKDWGRMTDLYLKAKGSECIGEERKLLQEGLEFTSHYTAARIVASSSSKMKQKKQTLDENERLISYA